MTIQQMHHVSVVVDDLETAKAFFAELGMEMEGQAPIAGEWVDRVNGVADPRNVRVGARHGCRHAPPKPGDV